MIRVQPPALLDAGWFIGARSKFNEHLGNNHLGFNALLCLVVGLRPFIEHALHMG